VPEGVEAARRRRQWGAIDGRQLLEEGEAEVANKGGGGGEGERARLIGLPPWCGNWAAARGNAAARGGGGGSRVV
jgi:hypothetical protein